MLGFRQLQKQINSLDYQSWTGCLRVLKRLEDYIREAKERRDGPARGAAEKALGLWLEATDKTPFSQTVVQSGNLLRTQAALKQLRALL